MDERIRFVARLLEGEKMAPLCAEFGISRKTGYKIFERYKDCGVAALPIAAGGRFVRRPKSAADSSCGRSRGVNRRGSRRNTPRRAPATSELPTRRCARTRSEDRAAIGSCQTRGQHVRRSEILSSSASTLRGSVTERRGPNCTQIAPPGRCSQLHALTLLLPAARLRPPAPTSSRIPGARTDGKISTARS